MEIKKAIKQTREFQNSHQKAMVNLIYTHNWMVGQMRSFFTPYGITHKQYNILRILRGANKSISTSEIRDRMLDKMSDASRMVDRLAQRNLVVKKVCPTDRRLVDVGLTEEGSQLLETIDKNVSTLNIISDTISNEEAEQLSRLLDKMRG